MQRQQQVTLLPNQQGTTATRCLFSAFPGILILLVLLAGSASAQTPVISEISYSNLTHSTIRWYYKSNVGGCFFVQYGTTSGQYPYRSSDFCDYGGPVFETGIAIGALAADTTYYFRLTARPNGNTLANICDNNACGSVEQVVTMPKDTGHLPVRPKEYRPKEIDTTGYVVVPMKLDPNTGKCVAAQAVPERSIGLNETMRSIVEAKLQYGTVVEFPQGVTCQINETLNWGIYITAMALDPQANGDIDSANHRWVVFRTASSNEADFPPYLSRTGPQWAPKMAKLQATVPQGNNYGELFLLDVGAHHIWFQNLEWNVDPSFYSPNAAAPVPYENFVMFQFYDLSKPIKHIVFDRIYMHGEDPPVAIKQGITISNASHVAVIGCYIDKIEVPSPGVWPTGTIQGGVGTDTISFPVLKWALNGNLPLQGMESTARATVRNATGSASYRVALTATGMKLYHNSNGTIICDACIAVKTTTFQDIPDNEFQWFHGSLDGNTWGGVTYEFFSSFTQGIWIKQNSNGMMLFSNNYFSGVTMSFYAESQEGVESPDDMVFERNHFIYPASRRRGSSNWNGRRYLARQPWEIKRGRRYLLKGNIFEGYWGFQNEGPGILLSVRVAYPASLTTVGITDVSIESNILRHASYGWTCFGSAQTPFDSNALTRVLFRNNLLFDINRYVYQDGVYGPGFQSGYMTIAPGCQDVTISHNTFGQAGGRAPWLILTGGGAVLPSGLEVTNNFFYMSSGIVGAQLIGRDDANYNQQTPFGRIPGPTGDSVKERLQSYFVNTAATIVPSYVWRNNVFIGGTVPVNGSLENATVREMTEAEVNQYKTGFPDGNFFPSGETIAQREVSAGFIQAALYNYRLSENSNYAARMSNGGSDGADIGVNHDDLTADIGKVTEVQVTPVSTAVEISYKAPDQRACAVDISTSGTNWIRRSDSEYQSLVRRTVPFDSLLPNQTYQYRITCYYLQQNTLDTLTPYDSSETTIGSFKTTETTTEVAEQNFLLQKVNGLTVSTASIEYRIGGAAPVVSPRVPCANGCSIAIPFVKGQAIKYRWLYQDAGGVLLRPSSWQARIAR